MGITVSIVIYNNNIEDVNVLISSVISNGLISRLFVIDNSEQSHLVELKASNKIDYIHKPENLGYGAAHNIAIEKSIALRGKYHIVLNPDIELQPNTITVLHDKAEQESGWGVIMPQILYKDGNIQYLCKKLPTPFDLFIRRFLPSFLHPLLKKRIESYELRHKDYNKEMLVPSLSGCFMFLNNDVVKTIGGFDTRYFMYMEDVDFCRRIGLSSKTIYYPESKVYHGYAKESYKSVKLLRYHIISAIKYFNKWGWLFDQYREAKNKSL